MSTARTSNPTTIPGISKPPADVSPALRRYLESLSETIEIRLGRRGDPRDRAITLRELIDSGLATELSSSPFNPNGGGNPTFQPPYDSTVPPTPTGFTANGGYAIVTLFWDYPKYGPHAHTEIWRNSANVIGDAQLVGISSGLSFVDPVGEGASFYYWIRHVSTSEVYSQFNSANGTLAQTALNVALLLATLNGAITESQLTQTLGSRINLIDASASTVNSVAYRIAAEATARAQAIATEVSNRQAAINTAVGVLQAQINDLSAIAEYNNSTAYVTGELVTYSGFLYKAKSATTGNLPTNTTYWELLGEYSSLADIVDQNAASIVQINTVEATSTSAAAQAIVGIKAEVFNANGTARLATASALTGLTSDVRAIYDGANPSVVKTAQQNITALQAQVFNGDGSARLATVLAVNGLTQNVEAIYNGANPSLITAIQSDITSLESQVFNGDGSARLATVSTVSGLTSEVRAVYDGNNPSLLKTAQNQITSLNSEVFNVNGTSRLATGESLTALTNEVRVIYNGANPSLVKTVQEDVTLLEGAVFDASGNVKLATAAAVSSLQTEVWGDGVTPGGATASRIDTLSTTLNDPNTGLQAVAYSLTTVRNEVFPNGVASASAIDALNAQVFDGSGNLRLATASALSTLNTQINGAGAIASKVDSFAAELYINGVVGGTPRLATASALSQISSEVFPNGTASASSITQLSSRLNNAGGTGVSLESAFSTQAGINTGLSAQYTVKIDNNNYVTGFGLASTPRDGTPFSEFTVRADRFAIASPSVPGGQNVITPFVVTTTTQIINGVTVPPGVYIDAAFVKNGTITNAKIGRGEIDNATIANLSADKINAGTLSAARIELDTTVLDTYFDAATGKHRLYIPNARIDNAQIKNLAVDTLKIAGAAITVPQTYTSGDILVSSAIVMTSGGDSYTYNYVGPGAGDYTYFYDPWYGINDYFYVGTNQGEYTRSTTTTSPTFTGATLVMETPTITIGVDTTAAVQFVFYATMDAAHTLDCGQELFMMLDKYDGNGYRLIGGQRVGTRTYSGDTKAILPITMTYTGTSLQYARIKIVSGTRLVDGYPGQGSNSSYLRNITLSVMGVKR
jgi:hypothetical protein